MAVIDEATRLSARAKRYRQKAGEAERAYADWLYEHRNDTDLWADEEVRCDTPEELAERRARFTVTISVRFDPALTRAMNERQKRTGETYSDLIRAAVEAYTRTPQVANLSPPDAPITVNMATWRGISP